MCGENFAICFCDGLPVESPPRMRGKQAILSLGLEEVRITPAHAGKTLHRLHLRLGCPDHPRVCGENFAICFCDGLPVESPPRMRGKLPPFVLLFLGGRITPAHAGKTSKSALTGCSPPDHPRACGENCWKTGDIKASVGSPPRMRGKLQKLIDTAPEARITPAHAGKTRLEFIDKLLVTDHPRACGENHSPLPCEPELLGSPPRVRGKLGHIARDSVCDGITPACAGKTQSVMWRRRAKRDHPRVCGENFR